MAIDYKQVEGLLLATIRRAARIMGVVGFCIMALGGFVLALHIFKLDSELETASRTMIISLYVLGFFFIAVGFGMLYMAMFKYSANGKTFLQRLEHQPGMFKEVYINHIIGTNITERIDLREGIPGLGTLNLVVVYSDNKNYQLQLKAQVLADIIPYIHQQVPNALTGW